MAKYTSQDSNSFIETLREIVDEVRSYSGRGMSGEACVGVVTGDPINLILDIWKYMIGATEDEETHLMMIKMLDGARTDNMGMRTIVYWPRLPWPEGRDSDG